MIPNMLELEPLFPGEALADVMVGSSHFADDVWNVAAYIDVV